MVSSRDGGRRTVYSLEYIEKQRLAHLGKKLSPEAREKIRVRRLAYLTPARKQQLSECMKGKRTRSLGYRHSEETKAKIGRSNKGKPNQYKGLALSEAQKQKISTTKREKGYTPAYCLAIRKRMSGVNNPNWNGGIGKLPYPFRFTKALKESIRNRDNHRCQRCNGEEDGRRHHVHHINYMKEDLRAENLIALCPSCHAKTIRQHDYWQAYFAMRCRGACPISGSSC